jgi:hypothetical protein
MSDRPRSLFRERRLRRGPMAEPAEPSPPRECTPDLEDLDPPSREEMQRLRRSLRSLDPASRAFLEETPPEGSTLLLLLLLARSRGIGRVTSADLHASYTVNLDAIPPGLLHVWEGGAP